MDRLICGDVGFGKTEVSVRAVFKAVQDGTQAAVLAPTTLLASQHAQTFADRFAPYPGPGRAAQPVPVAGPAEEGGRGAGRRQHRRGHRHPPAARPGRGLQATRPPGRRRGAAIRRHPQGGGQAVGRRCRRADPDRQPHPAHPGDGADRHPGPLHGQHPAGRPAADPDLRRRARPGRDQRGAPARAPARRARPSTCTTGCPTSTRWRARCSSLVPEARVAIAHGQMDEGSLETVVLDFWERRYDVLVCTTIIESGIDMPSVNTLIVDRADLLGLGQLHQIRGRVGRGGQRAYAYLFHPADRVLSEQAYERLRTIGEHTELGSGFKIAMRDLEIRGSGNLLGADQSGHIAAVGYDLYVQLVAEAVAEARGEARPDPAHGRARRPGRRPPAQGLRRRPRMPGWRPTGAWPRCRRTPTSRTSGPSGPTATARCPARPSGCWPWPACGRRPWPGGSARSP